MRANGFKGVGLGDRGEERDGEHTRGGETNVEAGGCVVRGGVREEETVFGGRGAGKRLGEGEADSCPHALYRVSRKACAT